MKADRIVCDTNVLISAAIAPRGKARRVVDHVIDHGRSISSREAHQELTTRLARPKFDKFTTIAERNSFIQALLIANEWVAISGTLKVCRDPDDDKILETAVVGRADWLVTGDKDLLALRPAGEHLEVAAIEDARYHGVLILRPAEFLHFAAV